MGDNKFITFWLSKHTLILLPYLGVTWYDSEEENKNVFEICFMFIIFNMSIMFKLKKLKKLFT